MLTAGHTGYKNNLSLGVTLSPQKSDRRCRFCQRDAGSSKGFDSAEVRSSQLGDDDRSLRGRGFRDKSTSVGVGVRDGEEGRRWFECCHNVKASPGRRCTLTPAARSWRAPLWRGKAVGAEGVWVQDWSQGQGSAPCPKSKR